jgi:hypothetical protein
MRRLSGPMAILVAVVVVAAGCGTPPSSTPSKMSPSAFAGTAAPIPVPRSVAAPTATVTPHCGNTVVGPAPGPSPNLPTTPFDTVARPTGGIVALSVNSSGVFVETPTQLIISRLSGAVIHSIELPSALRSTELNSSSLVVDEAGDTYLINYQTGALDKISPAGRILWAKTVGHPTSAFALGSGRSFRIAVSEVGRSGSQVFDAAGRPDGAIPLYLPQGAYATETTDGDLLVAVGGQFRIMNPTGAQLLREFGSQQTEGKDAHTGGPYQAYYPGAAVEGPDGTIYTADPIYDIEASTSSGLFERATTIGGKLQLAGGYLFLVNGRFYLESGTIFTPNVTVASISLATLDAYLSAPQASVDTLGWGAGLSTSVAGNYFPPGSHPTIDANFAPWWSEDAADLELQYSIWDAAQLGVQAPPVREVSLPVTAAALGRVPLPVPPAAGAPGPYEVEAALYSSATKPARLIGTTCLPYTVGAPGDRLDLAELPAGLDGGGAQDQRGVALNAQLGLNGLRSPTIDWTTFLPACTSSDPTAATCGAAAMVFTHAPQSFFQAAALASKDHVSYWIQVSGGDPVSMALTQHGWWQADIEKLVSYYAHPGPGCQTCAPVAGWEPWNEPNNTGWPTGAGYVSKVLEPFYKAVKAVSPGATVIGGSTLEVPLDWWHGLVAAGGLADMDVAAVHPYTGNDDAFEEDGILADVGQLQQALGSVPLWFTEVGWWGDGDYDFVSQANIMARAMMWQQVLHIPVWNYYYAEGSSPYGSVSFTLIETSAQGDDYVKAAALATMEASKQLDGRTYASMPATGIPHTFAAAFGPAPTGTTSLLAVWSDGLAAVGDVRITDAHHTTVPIGLVDEYGAAQGATLTAGRSYRLPISGEVTYIEYPTGDQITVGATDPYGTDLALASAGAKATASSGQASAAIAGSATGPGWSSAPGDKFPSLTVTLAKPATVNRIVVDTQSPGSTATGLRDYTVSGRRPDGTWKVVATVVGQFAEHIRQIDIPPQSLVAVRVTVTEINYGGYASGGVPAFWPLNQPGVAFVHALAVYAGTGTPTQVDGADLPMI